VEIPTRRKTGKSGRAGSNRAHSISLARVLEVMK
jgi:hypothetical protein